MGKPTVKKYSVNIDDQDRVVSVEVNGARYKTVDDIPGDEDRARMQRMISGFTEAGAPAGEPFWMSKVLVPLFLGVALLMFGIFVYSSIRTGQAIAREQTAMGRVVDVVIQTDSSGNEFAFPVIEFYLPDKTLQTVRSTVGSWPPTYREGQMVTVLYDPSQPYTARIRSASSTLTRWTVPIVTGILFLAFLGAAFFARWILKQ